MAGILTIDDLTSDKQRWKAIDWQRVYAIVDQIQARIVKAVKAGAKKRVRSLQRLLARSFAARLLAVKRVITNRGKNTAGIDGIRWRTPAQRWRAAKNLNRSNYEPLPSRRQFIPKKNGKKRPLSIPIMADRGEQAIECLALEPVAECTADGHSYGFRKERSIQDAIDACYNALRLKGSPVWIYEADIWACFDNGDHGWMLTNIPTNKRKLRKWLTAGYMEKGLYNPTEKGIPQGGIISPTLANITLDGLQALLHKRFKRGDKIHFVRYADDFIITGATKQLLENEVKPLVSTFLKQRGLELSEEKCRISHINDGFDFLGFHIRKHKGKLIIKPAKANVKNVLDKIRKTIKANKAAVTANLIYQLNPIIRGWGNNYRHVVSKRIYGYIDHKIWEMTWRWAKRRHPDKTLGWIKSKYYQQEGTRNWVFREKQDNTSLFLLSSIPIRRHCKIKADANPFDPNWKDYFTKRRFRNKW